MTPTPKGTRHFAPRIVEPIECREVIYEDGSRWERGKWDEWIAAQRPRK